MFTAIDILFCVTTAPVQQNPCNPTPCGPSSQCRDIDGHAVCSCVPGYIGSAPMCRPECIQSHECPLNKACMNQKCQDPCPGTCGVNAECKVVNHSPICSCVAGYEGNPFALCHLIGMILNLFLIQINNYSLLHFVCHYFSCPTTERSYRSLPTFSLWSVFAVQGRG